MFVDRTPLERTVRIGGIGYRVIGVVEKQGSVLGFPLDRFVVVPAFAPAQSLVNPPGVVDALLVKARSEVEMREAMEVAEGVMRSRRHLRPNQDNNFVRSEEHTSELQSHSDLVCRLLLEKKKTNKKQ